jgi:large subunit ribosomal protein L25
MPRLAFVREIQFHPLTSEVLHADLYGVDVARPVQVEVPVRLDGEAPAVRSLGGVLGQILHAITVECLPLEVPDAIRVDISGLDAFDKLIRVSDLTVPPHVSVLTDSSQVVVHVSPPRAEEKVEVPAAEAPVEAEEAEAEGEAPAEGEEKKE